MKEEGADVDRVAGLAEAEVEAGAEAEVKVEL